MSSSKLLARFCYSRSMFLDGYGLLKKRNGSAKRLNISCKFNF